MVTNKKNKHEKIHIFYLLRFVFFIIFFLISILLFFNDGVYAGTGEASGLFLKMPVGSRAIGIGGAFTSVAEDINSMFWNPGGLGFLKKNEIMFMHNNYFQDLKFHYLGAVLKFDKHKSALGLSVTIFDGGIFDRTFITGSQNNPEELTSGGFDAEDMSVSLSYGVELVKNIGLGASLKYLKSEIAEYSASGAAIDLGIQFKPELDIPVKFGLSLKNIGTKLKYLSEKEDLPLTIKAGCNADIEFNDVFCLIPAADIGYSNSSEMSYNMGIEFLWFKNYGLRFGFDSLNDAGSGITIGAGAKINEFSFDYAFVPYSKLGNSHNITLAYSFGKIEKEPEKQENLLYDYSLNNIIRQISLDNLKMKPYMEALKHQDIIKEELKVRNNIIVKNEGIKIFPSVIGISPPSTSQTEDSIRLLKIILESQIRLQVVLVHPENKAIYKETFSECLKAIEKENISSEYEALGAGLYLNAEYVIYGNLMVLDNDRCLYYYKIYGIRESKNVIEGILEFPSIKINDAVKIMIEEINK
ncbi:PorV/PorQ family protein [Candidatus Dependentiae bacterium]|nr:PorV/PorQ family protein [Candidatus Dependentiae bacterium]